MVNDTTEAAEAYVSAGDFPGAIRALQSLGTGAGRPDYEATIRLAREIRDRTAKGLHRAAIAWDGRDPIRRTDR